MEIKKHQYDLSLPFGVSSYINSLLQHVNNPALSDNVFDTSKNYIVVISENGYFKKLSSSFIDLLGYSEEDLLPFAAEKIVLDGAFILSDSARNYYFETTIRCKDETYKRIKWRLLPYVSEGMYSFLGWEIKF